MYILLGYLFAVITAGCWTQNSIIYTHVGKRVGSSTVTHIRLWLALPATIVIHLLFTGTVLPGNFSTVSYLFIGASGLFGFFIADLFIFKAFQHIGARKTMVIMTLSPIFSAVISWVMFNEILSLMQISGILITIGGVIAVILVESRKTSEHTAVIWIVFALIGAVTQAIGMVLAKAGLAEGIDPVSANVVRIGSGLGGLTLFTLLQGEFITDFKK
ncbi:MAG: DMT family transporter, partial [Spirochaetales bacterium]|nr:DMT family transporter [Spirochaetales bacterium]